MRRICSVVARAFAKRSGRRHQAGVALITTLILLSLMSALTLALLTNLSEDLRSSAALESGLVLFYGVDAGIEEMRVRWLYGASSRVTPPAAPTPDWAGYIRQSSSVDILTLDPAYDDYASTTVVDGLGTPPYTLVKIFYNTEANKNRDVNGDASLDSTTVLYLGDDGAGGLARNLTATGAPVLTIQAYVEDDDRREMVEAEIISIFVTIPTVDAVVRANDDATFNGNLSVNKLDSQGTLPGVQAGGTAETPGASQFFIPSGADDVVSGVTPDYDTASYVAAAAEVFTLITEYATPTVTQADLYRWTGFAVGSDASPALMYSDRSIDINGNNGSTYGIMVVDGDVSLSNLAFYGLIIASGDITMGGGGSSGGNIYGAAIAGGSYTGGGSFSLQLDRDRIDNYLNAIRTKVITFREIRK